MTTDRGTLADFDTFSAIIPIPDGHGCVVVGVADLIAGVIGEQKIDLDDLAFDSTFSDVETVEMVKRVRRLNNTGDINGFHAGLGSP